MAQDPRPARAPVVLPVLVVAAGLTGGYVAGYLTAGATGLMVAVAAGQLVVLGALLLVWRGGQVAAWRRHGEWRAGQRRLETRLRGLVRAAHRGERRLSSVVSEGLAELGTRQARRQQLTTDQLRAALRHQFAQLEALGALYYGARPERAIPPTRGWAASPDLLWYLYQAVLRRRPRLVLECGSGVSTLVLAYGLRSLAAGQVVALEHDQRHAEATRALLREHGLTQWAQVRAAPLTPVAIAGRTWRWYDPAQLPAGPVDLLFVDGPPGTVGRLARLPAVPVLRDRLSPDALVVLDDHDRDDEREVVRRWLEQLPGWVAESVGHEKGTAVLRCRNSADPDKI